MRCPYCNEKNPQKANYCSSCGKKLILDSIKGQPETKKQIPSYIIILSMTIVSVLVVLVILASNIPKTEENSKTTEISSREVQLLAQISELKERLAENPFDVKLNIRFANMLFDIQKFQEAKRFYRQALKLDPRQISAHIDLAICYYNMQQVDSALVEMKNALKIEPNHPKGLFNIGVMYYNIGNTEEAKTFWTKLIMLYDNTEEANRAKQLILNIQS